MTLPDPDQPTPLLGDLSPQAFMQQHWQRQPRLIRQALPGWRCPLSPTDLRRLARLADVESRLVWRDANGWQMRSGPHARLPKASQPDWTLLVQGVDVWDDRIAALRDQFRFVPDARLDDAMISLASRGGGVGPHFDSYDVFLLQARGTRRWRISQQSDLRLLPDLPLKVLANFQPEHEYLLEPGDMLYLPPHVAHDGIAESDDCMTISIGFRSPSVGELARLVLDLAAERSQDDEARGRRAGRYRDPGQAAVTHPAELPAALCAAGLRAARQLPLSPELATDALGRWLSEPKAGVVFGADPDDDDDRPDLVDQWPGRITLRLDRATRFLYRGKRGYINGEILGQRMTNELYQLADARHATLGPRPPARALRELLQDWLDSGWLHVQAPD